MKRIAVFTSGGDAPGMNACIRAVVRAAVFYKIEVFGILRGYQGMIDGNFIELKTRSVSNIIQLGGTILKTARSQEFHSKEGRIKAYNALIRHEIEGLIAIGGDGTFRGALELFDEFKFPVVGIPGTIDNDLFGSDFTLGYDTAINTAVEAIDKIRNTADSHDRIFFIEVMGRDSGYIAIESGIGGGAEVIMVPETITTTEEMFEILEQGWERKKTSSIVVVAEGDEEGGAQQIAQKVRKKYPHVDARVVVLGHIQRGGTPTAYDRLLGSLLGIGAVEGLIAGKKNVMAGLVSRKTVFTELRDAVKKKKNIQPDLLRITEILRT